MKLSVESNVDSLTVIKELINDGGIYTILPIGCVYQEALAGTLRVCRIVDPPIVNTFVLAAAQNRPFTAAMRTVRNALRDQIALAFTPEAAGSPPINRSGPRMWCRSRLQGDALCPLSLRVAA